jgi:GT2 family glycosyltransferase
MQVSIEVPVFKGRFLRPCIDSVLAQTSEAWTLSLVWDGGDEQSREILEQLEREGDPRVRIFYTENRGIAGARRFLTDNTEGEYILPLDDDDILCAEAVDRFLEVATERPWASLIRARRIFIDEKGAVVQQDPWFPFEPRSYDRGMVTDVFNQTQPYLIRRSAYERTGGWTGFADLIGAGEDCDIFLQLEEVAHFELVDQVLYHYRLHGDRASHTLTPAAAFEMWRRLTDAAIARMGLPLRRVSASPPFAYETLPRPAAMLDDVEFVIRGGDGRAAASLLQCGVNEEAIHETAESLTPGQWRMEGFRSTRRPLVSFLDEHVVIRSRPALETLIQALDGAQADLLVPRLRRENRKTTGEDQNVAFPWVAGEILLVRREVVAATGGFDDRYVPASLQAADFCIQARRREFRCVEIPVEGLIRHAPEPDWTPAEVSALRSKWRSHAELLEPYHTAASSYLPEHAGGRFAASDKDTSAAAGDGARRNRSAI